MKTNPIILDSTPIISFNSENNVYAVVRLRLNHSREERDVKLMSIWTKLNEAEDAIKRFEEQFKGLGKHVVFKIMEVEIDTDLKINEQQWKTVVAVLPGNN